MKKPMSIQEAEAVHKARAEAKIAEADFKAWTVAETAAWAAIASVEGPAEAQAELWAKVWKAVWPEARTWILDNQIPCGII